MGWDGVRRDGMQYLSRRVENEQIDERQREGAREGAWDRRVEHHLRTLTIAENVAKVVYDQHHCANPMIARAI